MRPTPTVQGLIVDVGSRLLDYWRALCTLFGLSSRLHEGVERSELQCACNFASADRAPPTRLAAAEISRWAAVRMLVQSRIDES